MLSTSKLDAFRVEDTVLIQGSSDDLRSFAEFLSAWSNAPTEGYLSDIAGFDPGKIPIKIIESGNNRGRGMHFENGAEGTCLWTITKLQAARFSEVVAELAASLRPGHVYLDSPRGELAVVVSMGEYQ
ncbi:MAG TPA: hypothetical protein VD865_13030 [Stenotrophomonas sp.]|nr:hypothetical protein [Stenotrophomonas sp.]